MVDMERAYEDERKKLNVQITSLEQQLYGLRSSSSACLKVSTGLNETVAGDSTMFADSDLQISQSDQLRDMRSEGNYC